MKSVKYLENLSEMTGMNDSNIAKALGITKAAVSQYRHGTRIMDDETCKAVADALGIDPILVVAAACVDRAEKTGQRSLWEDFLKGRMATAAALLFAVCVTNFLTLPEAKAAQFSYETASVQHDGAICIMSNCFKAIMRKLRTVFAWFEGMFSGTALKTATS